MAQLREGQLTQITLPTALKQTLLEEAKDHHSTLSEVITGRLEASYTDDTKIPTVIERQLATLVQGQEALAARLDAIAGIIMAGRGASEEPAAPKIATYRDMYGRKTS